MSTKFVNEWGSITQFVGLHFLYEFMNKKDDALTKCANKQGSLSQRADECGVCCIKLS